MEITEFTGNKKQYLSLLLLADESEEMIDHYLEIGTMYILNDNGIKAECVVSDKGEGIIEIMNLAVEPSCQKLGYGRALINYVSNTFRHSHSIIQVGTGDSPLTIPFYEKCGFKRVHIIKNFFTDNYDHPIFEEGVQLVDMIILRKEI